MDTVACPHCSGEILDDPALAGLKIDCPHCGKKIKMLDTPAARPAVPRAAPPRGAVPPLPAAPRHSDSSVGQQPYSFAAAPPAAAPPPDAGPGLLIDPAAKPTGNRTPVPRKPDGNAWVIPTIVGVGVIVIVGLLIALRNRSASYDPNGPAAMVVSINRIGCNGDWGGVYDRLSRATQQQIESRVASSGGGKPLTGAALQAAARAEFVRVGKENSTRGMQWSLDPIIVSETQTGNRASVVIRGSGGTQTLNLVYENRGWRLDLF